MLKSKTADRLATVVLYIIASGIILLLLSFVGYLLYQGRERLNLHFIISSPVFMKEGGGIGPQLFNSLYIVFLSMIITVPIGLAAGVYLSEYSKPGKVTDIIRFCIEALASLPSIVIGLFGLLVFVSMTGWGYTLFSGALAVAVLNLPVITRISEDAIRNVPDTVKEASLAMGATHWQTIYKVIIPTALPALVTGLIMTSGRVFGEAAALLYTAGMSSPNLNFDDWNPFHIRSPLNPFRPAETLAVYIWKVNSEGLAPDARQIADGASAILIIFVFIFNIVSRFLGRVLSTKFAGRKN
ncbi:phosphate ABC transporter, inner membrane subunit PstA [Ruminiclostridium papyrosolvens DSM 2782]|uniref:Phosphate transport system permease protein PstA n=1 Tax=Ruminiclostridium papyrosolvens DSM 2782 TaxID=588581 RepID=F1TDB6_9FIRM|nr:phosphate ABC transporter permease PstA [Ruminiclostridium papyrosolvens]EGD47554.1 phosphate ABC transporter, inner membrane subunit PstA [Ruminiclostridium papyrosolvens DSM 2782]WES36500.1 phosphate ABC transporter permease PstA [Ruminiclostridium papyrosolvens DSM 2782]